MKNTCISLLIVWSLCCGLHASQDDPFHMTHAQAVEQEKARRLAAAAQRCQVKSKEIRDRLAYRQALVDTQKKADEDKKAARMAAREAELSAQILNTFVRTSGPSSIGATGAKSAENPNVPVLPRPVSRPVCELSPLSQGKNEGSDVSSDMDGSSGVRPYRRFSDSWSGSVDSRNSLRSDSFKAGNGSQGSLEEHYESTQESSVTSIKKIFCCCDDS